jgi:RNA polymerase sigma factor FliA
MAIIEAQFEKSCHDDQALRNNLVIEYLPFVKRIVNRIASHLPSYVDKEDLLHSGIIGLIQAIDRYDPTRDSSLKTYAAFRIRGSVLSELRSRDYLSRSNRKKIREMDDVYLRLEKENEGDVDDETVASELGVSLDEYYQIRATANICFISIDEIDACSKEEKEKYVRSLVKESVADALTMTKLKELRSAVVRAIEKLPEKEKLVLSLYYVEELNMKEIGKVMELTESRVSQIHSQAIIHMRSRLRKEGLLEG